MPGTSSASLCYERVPQTFGLISMNAPQDSQRPSTSSAQPPARSTPEQSPGSQGSGRTGAAIPWTLASLFLIAGALFIALKWSGYAERYAHATEGWHLGGTHLVEITLVREDAQNLACASEVTIAGLRCAYGADQKPRTPPEADLRTLRPYMTVKNQLLIGAGLWSSPNLVRPLPAARFSVVCNFHVEGAARSLALRWAPAGRFEPVPHSAPLGTLKDCRIPP